MSQQKNQPNWHNHCWKDSASLVMSRDLQAIARLAECFECCVPVRTCFSFRGNGTIASAHLHTHIHLVLVVQHDPITICRAPSQFGYIEQCMLIISGTVHTEKFRRALAWQGMDLDMDEVECILANLIANRMVRPLLVPPTVSIV